MGILATNGNGNGKKWVLSVGATPTAHAATQIEDGGMDLEGVLELYVSHYLFPFSQYTYEVVGFRF